MEILPGAAISGKFILARPLRVAVLGGSSRRPIDYGFDANERAILSGHVSSRFGNPATITAYRVGSVLSTNLCPSEADDHQNGWAFALPHFPFYRRSSHVWWQE
jgi:hypothetical protein